jgi:hypothetical protein
LEDHIKLDFKVGRYEVLNWIDEVKKRAKCSESCEKKSYEIPYLMVKVICDD